jgi:transposase InsO family protein
VVHEANRVSKQTCGARRIAEEVEAVGVPCGKTKARTLMKLANVTAKQKKKFKVTTDSKHNLPVAPNLLECKFRVAEPDKVYVFDLAYLWTQEGWLYLVVVSIFSPGRLQGGP